MGDPLSLRKRQPACGGSEAQGERQGRVPGPGAAAKPGCTVGTRPDTGPSSPPSRRRHRPRGPRDGRAPGGRGRAGGGTGHGAPGTAGHREGGQGRWPAPPPDIGAALGRTQGPGRGAWRRRAALRAPSPGRGRATPPTATQRPWGRFRRENAGCRSPRPGVLVPLGEGRGDRVRGGGLRGAEAEEAE